MDKKKEYKILCKNEKSIPIFSQYWWLDCVCGPKNWDVVLIKNNEKISASLPFYVKHKNPFYQISMPPLTQKMGPWIKQLETQKNHSKISNEINVLDQLFSLLPKFDFFSQNFSHEYQFWLPLKWRKYSQTTLYTYILENINEHEKIYNNYSSNLRRAIRKAEKHVKIIQENDVNALFGLIKMTFDKSPKNLNFSFNLFEKLYTELIKREQCLTLFAIDNDTNTKIASAFFIWDNNCAYYLAGGANPKFKHYQPQSLLLHVGIKEMAKFVNIFDFEGSSVKSIESFFRSYGGYPKAFSSIKKTNSKLLKIKKFINNF